MIDGIVGHRHGTMAALIGHREGVVDDILLAHLQVVGDLLPVLLFAPSTLVEREVSVNQVAVILDKPVHAVVWAAALLISSERYDDVAVGFETLPLHPDQGCDPDRSLRLIVTGAAAIEITILLVEDERVYGPVLALSLDHVGVGQKQQRPLRPGA